jgi:uncharacterized protein
MAQPTVRRSERPYPVPDRDTAPFWEAAGRGQLVLPRCLACSRFHFYPRAICPHCMSDRLEWASASGRGTVHSFTVVHRPPPGFDDEAPYVVALVDLEEGVRMMSRVAGCEVAAVRIGMDVEVAFRAISEAGPHGMQLPFFTPKQKEAQ